MDSRYFDRRDSSASGFQILASSLPEMVKAMSQGNVDKKRKLGGISSGVARHLKAEICSIFLLDRYEKLFLEEAYGYDVGAIGTEKSLEEGLTARILKDKLTMVANFDVQDREGWKGQLDDKLKGHCWCMLGVPIVGANDVVRGVIKVENRRRQLADQNNLRDRGDYDESSISEMCTFLRAMALPKNTPKAICEIVDGLADKTLRVLDACDENSSSASGQFPNLRILVEQTRLLADGLAKCRVSAAIGPAYSHGKNIPCQDASDNDLNNLESSTLEKRISSLRWYTEALTASVMRIMSSPPIKCDSEPSQEQVDVLDASRRAVALLQSLKLALDAYQPFGQEDLYLMRTVAAMIAAALDIREAAGRELLHTFQHALKNVGSQFLREVRSLIKGESDTQEKLSLFRIALYISGPHKLIGAYYRMLETSDTNRQDAENITFEDLYERNLKSRILYYYDYLSIAQKDSFLYPQKIPDELNNIQLLGADAIIGALDIIIVNAEEHGGKNVQLDIQHEGGDHSYLVVSDDGDGFKEKQLSSLSERSDLKLTLRGQFGLSAAKRVLEEAHMKLELGNNLEGYLKGAYAKIVIPIRR